MISLLLMSTVLQAKTPAPKGRRCTSHPVQEKVDGGVKPEIIRSWNYHHKDGEKKKVMIFKNSFYQPRYTKHEYMPAHKSANPDKYNGLDLFVTESDRNSADGMLTLHFQRRARVYILVQRSDMSFKTNISAVLDGWKSEGWAVLKSGCSEEETEFGVMKPSPLKVVFGKQVYVFSNEGKEADEVTLPSFQAVHKQIKDARFRGAFLTLVAEQDGSDVKKAQKPTNFPDIIAGQHCPPELHDLWYTRGDSRDPHTPQTGYRTFHPLWDPCYWCSYDHEHGSDPVELMGYTPKFGYTALKNGEIVDGEYRGQDESHNGFKGMVLELDGNMFMYFQVHVLLSDARRYHARTHTMVIAVTRKVGDSVDILMELSFKADFGFATAKAKQRGNAPLTDTDRGMKDAGVRPFRILNVVNTENLDKDFRYNRIPLHSQNEHWFTTPICASGRSRGTKTKLEIRDPATGVRFRDGLELVELGRTEAHDRNTVKYQNPSVNRDFTANNVEFGVKYCGPYYLYEIGSAPVNGEFYTDPTGLKLVQGPAQDAIKQYINLEFSVALSGKWRAIDTWLGLHRNGWNGHMRNVGNGIAPMRN